MASGDVDKLDAAVTISAGGASINFSRDFSGAAALVQAVSDGAEFNECAGADLDGLEGVDPLAGNGTCISRGVGLGITSFETVNTIFSLGGLASETTVDAIGD